VLVPKENPMPDLSSTFTPCAWILIPFVFFCSFFFFFVFGFSFFFFVFFFFFFNAYPCGRNRRRNHLSPPFPIFVSCVRPCPPEVGQMGRLPALSDPPRTRIVVFVSRGLSFSLQPFCGSLVPSEQLCFLIGLGPGQRTFPPSQFSPRD